MAACPADDRRSPGVTFAVEASGLEKTFFKRRSIRSLILHPFRRPEPVKALRGVDLQVREGEIFSLLGPNGAGKTTLLKILSCLVLPDRGRAVVGGHETRREYLVKKRIGLVHSDERSFYWRLSARENLRFFARLYDVPGRKIEGRVEELLRRVDLLDAADRPFSDYSSGMKQRVAIARALLHDPPILLMDEPTRSLDPVSSLSLRAFILDELSRCDGKTIVLATHNLREAEAVSDRIAILVKGKVRQLGTVREIRKWGVREERFRLELEGMGGELRGPFRTISDETEAGARSLTVVLDPEARLGEMLSSLIAAGAVIKSCDRLEPDLEEAFSRIMKAEEDGE
jgi:ABC-2 type transport system ATP-binding protein